jgi:hypothetical protein
MSAAALAYPVRTRHAEIYAKRQAVLNPPVVLAVIRKPEAKPRENVETWLRKSLAARARIPGPTWKDTAFAKGKYRMLIGGAPCYFAAHVKTWKASNRAALCKGFDAWGLELVRGNLAKYYPPTPEARSPTLFDFARRQRRLHP